MRMKSIKVISRYTNLAIRQVEEVFSLLGNIPYETETVLSYGDIHKEIALSDNNIADISKVKFPKDLQELYLNDNIEISDISGNIFPGNLQVLFLRSNKITDISGTKLPVGLHKLWLSGNNLPDNLNKNFNSSQEIKQLFKN